MINLNSSLLVLVSAIVFHASCNNDPTAELRDLEREVMQIHDEVMPEMTTISMLRVQLKTYVDSVVTDQEMLVLINSQIAELNRADSLMWKWMHEYQRPNYEDGLAEVGEYLEQEKEEITEVKGLMLKSITDARALLDSIEHK